MSPSEFEFLIILIGEKISKKDTVFRRARSVCDALVEKLKHYIQVRQILLFVVYERSLKLDCNQNFYLNTNFTETLLFKTGRIILQTSVYFLLKMS
jgi:hypothetical protein